MSVITSVIVSVYAVDPAKEEDMVESVQRWALNHGHMRFARIGSGFGTGGGEKSLTCSLLIGTFNHFDTEDFRAWLAGHPLFDSSREYQQIDLIVQEVDREDFARWRVLPMGERRLDEMGEEYKVLNHLSEKWEAEKARVVEEEREACAKVIDAKIEDWKRCMRTMKHFTGTHEEVDLMEDMAVAIRARARSDAKPG